MKLFFGHHWSSLFPVILAENAYIFSSIMSKLSSNPFFIFFVAQLHSKVKIGRIEFVMLWNLLGLPLVILIIELKMFFFKYYFKKIQFYMNLLFSPEYSAWALWLWPGISLLPGGEEFPGNYNTVFPKISTLKEIFKNVWIVHPPQYNAQAL
jgi:hypothetical protein